jgi:methionyl-tRNA synthetase
MLCALDLPLPTRVITHGHWLVNNKKMSKSDLTGVSPLDIARFGTDTVRFMLLRHGRLEGDMSYYSELCNDSWAELASLLGNLASRITSKKYTEKLVKFEFDFDSEQQTLCERLSYITQQSHALYETGQIYKHIELIFSHLKEVNR